MNRSRRQAGEGQAGCLVGIIFLLLAIFVAYKLIPIKVKAAELRDVVMDESKSAGNQRHDDAYIMKAILTEAERNQLPVTKENVDIRRTSNSIAIDVKYEVPVKFPGYTYIWKFHHHTDNPIF